MDFDKWWNEVAVGIPETDSEYDLAKAAYEDGQADNADLRAEVDRLTAVNLDLTERVLYAERERDEARESFLAHDAALTTEHGLRTEAEAWLETALSKVNKLTAELARKDAALEQLARLGNGEQYGNSIGNTIARDALEAK